ncbi:winged helix-turn-helix domain-containing protein [Abyssibacter sp.]|uniref:protein kinase domain-containing protein n=1 Tax=Abyssibacter sp. TaxID=2320200 RepID=UPI003512473E
MSEGSHLYRWRFGDMQFDEARLELRVSGLPVDVEQKPLQVLAQLLRHAGEVVTKEELFETVWQGRVTVDHVLATAIGKLRKVFGDDGTKLIVTVPRVGYRLAIPVERVAVGRRHTSQMDLTPGAKVPGRDHFQLERQLSPSGSSEVWLARHSKTGEQRVYKFSPDGSRLSSLKREATLFRVLRESLGERDDFVRIIDWNFETAPFFLECEFGGQNLSDWAQTGDALDDMSLDERLAFFIQICDTVSAAHSVGVLHKDLKPGNVLVTGEDGAWRTRLTDFGSSRLLEPGRLDELGITNLGLTLTQGIGGDSSSGTPLYLAPELVAGHAPTVQSDVYALGIMLYQILVGDLSRPMAPGWERDIADELLQEDVARATDGHPARRLPNVSELTKRLRTLESRHSERQHIADAELQNRIAAQTLERAKARRPWIAATIGMLVVGLATTLWLFEQSDRARVQAEQERRRAEATVAFLTDDIIGGANPGRAGFEKNPTVQELLELASNQIEQRFADEPATEAAVWQAMGDAAFAIHQFRDAKEYFQNAVKSSEVAFGESDTRIAAALYNVALAQSYAEDAKSLNLVKITLERADTLAGEQVNKTSELALLAARAHAGYHATKLEPALALPYLEKTASLLQRLRPEARLERFSVQSQITEALLRQGKPEAAMKRAQSLIQQMDQTPTDGGQELRANVQMMLARSLRALHRFDEAVRAAELALENAASVNPDSRTVLLIRSQLAAIYDEAGDCEQSLEVMREVSAEATRLVGLNNRFTLIENGNLGFKEYECGDPAVGLALVEEVGETLRVANGNDDTASQAFRVFAAEAYADKGQYDRSLALLDGLEPAKLAAAQSEPEWAARLEAIRGQALLGKGKYAEAVALLKAAIPQLRKLHGDPEAIEKYERCLETARGELTLSKR